MEWGSDEWGWAKVHCSSTPLHYSDRSVLHCSLHCKVNDQQHSRSFKRGVHLVTGTLAGSMPNCFVISTISANSAT